MRTYIGDLGECSDHISGLQDWDGGLQFSVAFKNGQRELNGWKASFDIQRFF